MMALVVRLLLSTWLFISAFVLAQSTVTAWNALIVAFLVAAVSFLAFATPGRPGLRYLNAVLATWLLISAIVLPHESLGTVLHDVGLALLIAAVTFVAPPHWLAHWREEHASAGR
jgi:hypothetical protein